MTQQNAALVEQSAAAAESLKDQAQRLAQVVASFRLAPSSEVSMAAPVAARRARRAGGRDQRRPVAMPGEAEAGARPGGCRRRQEAGSHQAHIRPAEQAIKAVKAAASKPAPIGAPAPVRSEPKPVEPKPAAPPRVIAAPADGEWETF